MNHGQNIERQLTKWTVVGPVPPTAGMDLWIPLGLDAAQEIAPDVKTLNGHSVVTRQVALQDHKMDLWQVLGRHEGRPQAFAFARFATPAEGTLTLLFDVDFFAIVWVDGREVFNLRDGNNGPYAQMRHRILIPLPAGNHAMTIRVISGSGGWGFTLSVADWFRGVPDLVRMDRDAAWRKYTNTLVRHENRPEPAGQCGGISVEQYELLMANLGVDARWLSVMDHDVKPCGLFYDSAHLPHWPEATPRHEANLAQWVKLLHARRICAMSWMALSMNRAAWDQRPDWRQHYLVSPPPESSLGHGACCINSPYGEALIQCCIEALHKFNLDGLWFDACFFSPIWAHPQPVSCVCPHCARKFKADTGFDLPAACDWTQPVFRRWVEWRYAMFSAYWQRLVDAVHQAVPQATVVFNHYHREHVGWNSAIPLNPFGHGFVSGIEADGELLKGAFYTRLMRAYGRPHTEVWMGLNNVAKPTLRGALQHPRKITDFAIACATAGGHASVGGGRAVVEALVLGNMARELMPRAPYLNLPSLPYAALHVSQQTDTFVFGRNPEYLKCGWHDEYWASLAGWHHLLAHAGLTCDVVFDAHLDGRRRTTAARPKTAEIGNHELSDYPLLIMPLAPALTEKQARVVLNYVRQGGTLITGPWFGVCDEWGVPRPQALGDRSLFPFGRNFPEWEQINSRAKLTVRLPDCRGKRDKVIEALLLAALPAGIREWRLKFAGKSDWIAENRIGKGRVIQLAADLGSLFRCAPARAIVATARPWLAGLARPPVEVADYEGLILGLFKQKRDVIVHLQQFAPPWQPQALDAASPPMRWNTVVTWRGARPKAVRCCLPEPGPALPMHTSGKAWHVELPPFRRGQVLRIESADMP